MKRRLVENAADEERSHPRDELGGLAGWPHVLDQLGQRVEPGAYEPEDELVVIAIEPVAFEPDVARRRAPKLRSGDEEARRNPSVTGVPAGG